MLQGVLHGGHPWLKLQAHIAQLPESMTNAVSFDVSVITRACLTLQKYA